MERQSTKARVIGLSICKKIVELHGGSIRVESRLGEGSTFILELQKADDLSGK
jgi:signal transduction histidine kinase